MPRRVLAPEVRVIALTLGLSAFAAAVLYSVGSVDLHPPLTAYWWAFVPAAIAGEAIVFHIERHDQTHSFNLNEIPLVIGLFFAAPLALVGGRLLGHLLYRMVRRQSPLKAAFNLASFAAESAVAIYIFRLLSDNSGPLSPSAWLTALVAVLAADGLSLSAVTAVIHWTGGRSQVGEVVSTGAFTAIANTALAVLAAIILWASPWAFFIYLAVVTTTALAYRRHVSLRQKYSSLQMLYGFTQLVSASLRAETVTEEVLAEARKLLRAATAEIVLLDDNGSRGYRLRSTEDGAPAVEQISQADFEADEVLASVIREREPKVIPRGTRNRGHLSLLNSLGAADCMVAPLVADGRVAGTIMVADRLSNVSTFDAEDLRIFATLANHVSVAFENGRLVGQLRREAAERLHQALHDSLTGLPNRTMFVQRLAECSAHGETAGVMLMDLDRFKEVNDTLGHHNGDLLLQEVARRLLVVLRSHDTVARLGGDEFAILLPRVKNAEEAEEAARRVVSELREPFTLEGLLVDIGASVGVAMFPQHGSDAATLLQRADVAMYQAKGSDQSIAVYSPDRDYNSPERLALASELRGAINEGHIEIFYQPQARLADGQIIGVEALVRWRHPERGLLDPNLFIPIAEQTGLITPLTLFVIERTLAECQRWENAGHDLTVSVNLAVRSLLDKDLPHQIEDLVLASGVDPKRLTLEITESSVMADPARTIAVLEHLAAIGVKLSVDDFGTGYSSLSYLRRLPVHEVKVDQSFVFRIASDESDAAIVRSIVELAHNLGLHVVAEGVEDRISWDMLNRMGCDEAQGYYISKPISVPALDRWLNSSDWHEESHDMVRPHQPGVATVLVVDDDRRFRNLVRGMLDDGRYQVFEAGDGWEAVFQARRHQPDIVLLDMAMPKMDGLDALPNIRAVSPSCRVLAISASDDEGLVAAATRRGAAGFIDKVRDIADLDSKMQLALAS
jgi:diguanylate cyclase (GGDEF)-like protein